MGSWTDDEMRESERRRDTLYDEELEQARPAIQPSDPGQPVHPPSLDEVIQRGRRDGELRERLRTEELEHLAKLRDRVQEGLDARRIDPVAGATMLLNISRARAELGGVVRRPEVW